MERTHSHQFISPPPHTHKESIHLSNISQDKLAALPSVNETNLLCTPDPIQGIHRSKFHSQKMHNIYIYEIVLKKRKGTRKHTRIIQKGHRNKRKNREQMHNIHTAYFTAMIRH
jgi:hypothetical protein